MDYVETDIADVDDLATLVEATREFDGVDVMVNNAGLQIPKYMLGTTPEEFDRIDAIKHAGSSSVPKPTRRT